MERPERSRSARIVPWLVALPYVAAGLGVALSVVVLAAGAPPEQLIDSFDDDAYYYFEVARHLARGHGSTFDGLEPTNGYHPLWLLVLAALYRLPLGGFEALVAVKVLSAVCWLALVACFWAVARRLDLELEASPGLVPLVLMRGLVTSGMETTLTLPLLAAVIWAALRARLFEPAGSTSTAPLRLPAALLALAMLSRLDLVFFVAAVGAVCLLTGGGPLSARLRRAVALGAPSAGVLAIYMGVNQLVFGTPSPVSGQAKTLGGDASWLNPSVFTDYLAYRPLLFGGLDALGVGVYLLVLVAPALVVLRAGRPPSARRLEPVLWALLLGNLAQLGYYAVRSTWPLWRWYYYYVPWLLALSVTVLAAFTLALVVPRLPRRARTALRLAVPLAVALVVTAKVARSHQYHAGLETALTKNYKTQSLAVAEMLHRTTPDDAVVAMGDRAGSLAYVLERPLVQLEGLVASPEYLDALESGRVHGYLRRHGVDYVVYSGGPRSGGDPEPLAATTGGAGEGCARLREPKWGRGPKLTIVVCDGDLVYHQRLDNPGAMGGATWVWRYRPELNP